jgi:DNA-binding XRE family transcriptional regulator
MRKAREKQGLSQAEMAEKIGVSQSTLSGWENGDYLPESWRLRDVAEKYRLDLDDIVPEAA